MGGAGLGWQVVGSKTQRAVTTAVLRHTEVAVEEVSWLITSMRSGTVSHACSTSRSQLETAVRPQPPSTSVFDQQRRYGFIPPFLAVR